MKRGDCVKIFLFPNVLKENILDKTIELVKFLEKNNCCVLMQQMHKNKFSHIDLENVSFMSEDEILSCSELVLVLGGDGTILRAAKLAANAGIPILGINLGRIGYMAEIDFSQLKLIEDLLANPSQLKNEELLQTRMMLECTVTEDGNKVFSGVALNDVAVSKGTISRMIDVSLSNCGANISRYRADGLIISTPTGSTAYSMSAGGPIVDPEIECICMTPVCPYMAKSRNPIIFSPESTLSISFNKDSSADSYITLDGYESFRLSQNSKINIYRSKKSVKLIHVRNVHFYELLHEKMS